MAQTFCPQCGSPMPPGQRFCSNCGSTIDAGFGVPTAAASSGDQYPPFPSNLSAPPPPPSGAYNQIPPATNTYYPPQAAQSYQPAQQNFQAAPPPVPTYAKPAKDSSKGVLGQIGCGVLLVILLIVGLCGGGTYLLYRYVINAANSTTTGTTTTTDGNGNSGTPQAIPTTTAQINQSLTYSSVDFTIVNVQEASSFTDDSSPSSPVTLRINVTEHNPTADTVYLNYTTQLQVVLPDKTTVTAGTSKVDGIIGQAVQRTNWIDFPLTKSIPINQLTLQFGAASETLMSVPLTGSADLSAYKLKSITPNAAFQYGGVNWTLTAVTSSLSANGKQADTGMRFIVLTLKADNPSTNGTFYTNADNMRLQSGSVTNSSTNNALPYPLNAGTTGATGTITFMMPQNNSSFTFIMLAQPTASPPIAQVSTNFQI
jgi:zinc-ribbon domain